MPWLSNWSIETVSAVSASVRSLVKVALASPVMVTPPARSSVTVPVS